MERTGYGGSRGAARGGGDAAADLEYEDEAVQDFIHILEEHCKNCERTGRYVEAGIAKKRLEELRVHEENRRREALRSRQLAERLGVEEAHALEHQAFVSAWNRRMAEFEENAARLLLAMKTRHANELRAFQQRLIAKASVPRHSKEYLTTRAVQEKLARMKRYADAAKMKAKADQLAVVEEEKHVAEAQAEMWMKEMRFKQKLKLELLALRKRIQDGAAEQRRRRQRDLERLIQRYNNVKATLEQQQRLERMKYERGARARASAAAAKKG